MFAALLGYNPIQNLLRPSGVLRHLPAHNVQVLTGRQFFPHLISAPFHHGLVIVFTTAAIMSVPGALVSLLRGKRFYWDDTAAAGDSRAAAGDSRAAAGDSRAPATAPAPAPPLSENG